MRIDKIVKRSRYQAEKPKLCILYGVFN